MVAPLPFVTPTATPTPTPALAQLASIGLPQGLLDLRPPAATPVIHAASAITTTGTAYTYNTDDIYACETGYTQALNCDNGYFSCINNAGYNIGAYTTCACNYGFGYLNCYFSALSAASCGDYVGDWFDYETEWYSEECGTMPPSAWAQISAPTSVSLEFATVTFVTASVTDAGAPKNNKPLYQGSGEILTGVCTSTDFTLIDIGSTVFYVGFVGCNSDKPQCCPWTAATGSATATTTATQGGGVGGNGQGNDLAFPTPLDSNQAVLANCAADYYTVAGGKGCCPTGYFPFTSQVGGQTPCWKTLGSEATPPPVTRGLPGEPPVQEKPTSAVVNIVWAMQYPVGSGGGLSKGAIIGIGVGGGVGAIALFGLAFCLWRMKRKRKQAENANNELPPPAQQQQLQQKQQQIDPNQKQLQPMVQMVPPQQDMSPQQQQQQQHMFVPMPIQQGAYPQQPGQFGPQPVMMADPYAQHRASTLSSSTGPPPSELSAPTHSLLPSSPSPVPSSGPGAAAYQHHSGRASVVSTNGGGSVLSSHVSGTPLGMQAYPAPIAEGDEGRMYAAQGQGYPYQQPQQAMGPGYSGQPQYYAAMPVQQQQQQQPPPLHFEQQAQAQEQQHQPYYPQHQGTPIQHQDGYAPPPQEYQQQQHQYQYQAPQNVGPPQTHTPAQQDSTVYPAPEGGVHHP